MNVHVHIHAHDTGTADAYTHSHLHWHRDDVTSSSPMHGNDYQFDHHWPDDHGRARRGRGER